MTAIGVADTMLIQLKIELPYCTSFNRKFSENYEKSINLSPFIHKRYLILRIKLKLQNHTKPLLKVK